MDDDGGSGRWMARGNMGKLTPIEAFMSDDGKRGREFTDGAAKYRRAGSVLQRCVHGGSCTPGGDWKDFPVQVAAMEGTVTWADEPKTLTPQEVALHLASGGCISEGIGFAVIRLRDNLERYDFRDERWVEIESQYSPSLIGVLRRQPCPDPSQPAEPSADPYANGYTVDGHEYDKDGMAVEAQESAGDMLARLGMDAGKWAAEFCKITGFKDEGLMIGWFANAIMAGYDRGAPICGDHLEDMIKREAEQAEPTKPPLKVGDRVKRGPDWKWPNDARRGGVVDEVNMDAEEVWVKWDSGFTSGHRYGANGKYDIEKIEAEPQDSDNDQT